MSPTQHPAAATLVDYAAGTCDAGRTLVIAAHVAACPACRQAVRLAEAVGGVLMDDLAPTPMGAGALDAALARLDDPPRPEPRPPAQRPDWITVPPLVLEAARRRKRWAAPGVWVAPITRGPGRRSSYLLRVGAGMAMPRHTHQGVETILVLKGAYEDRGVLYGPGDLAENDETVDHRPQVTREGECVCLVNADAPLTPLDWVGRLFQPFVGI